MAWVKKTKQNKVYYYLVLKFTAKIPEPVS